MESPASFEVELAWIKNEKIRNFTKLCLENAPAYFYTNASSSTGKYHSTWSNGDGGLIRHTKATAFVAKELAPAYDLTADETDAVVSAAILHDLCKYGIPGGKHTTSDHDYKGALMVHFLAKPFAEIGEPIPMIAEICAGIAWHFGKWSKRKEGVRIKKFPEEYSKIETLVHIADMVASRKGITFDFLEESSLCG
jgi:hypothetical protein